MRLFSAVILLLALVVAALLVWVLGGFEPSASATTGKMPAVLHGKAQGHVFTGATEEPSDVNPFTSRQVVAQAQVLRVTHDALLDRDSQTGELRNALAESYELSADGSKCTFVLRDGLVFSDGSPVTMADVLFGWELAQAGHLPMGFVGAGFARVAKVDVLDERRLQVHLRSSNFSDLPIVGEAWLVGKKAFFVERVRARLAAGEAMPAVTEPRFAELLDQVDLETGPGTGPYALHNDPVGVSNWRPRQDLLLVRNELSWHRQVRPGCWNFAAMKLLFRDAAGSRNALLLGEVDWYSGAGLDRLLAEHEQVRERYRKQTYDYPQLGVYRIVWNCARPPFDNANVRRAMGMLVNRDDIVTMLGGAGRPAVAHGKPDTAAYPTEEALSFDLAGARQLLRQEGFDPSNGKPLKLTLLALAGSEPLRRIRELFQDAARQAGIDIEVHARELSAFLAEQKRGEWDGALVLQSFDASGDPYRFLNSGGRSNPGKWSNAEADQLSSSARSLLDGAARRKQWRELHRLAHREQPATLIVHPLAAVLISRRMQGYEPGVWGLRPEWAWVAPEAQRRE